MRNQAVKTHLLSVSLIALMALFYITQLEDGHSWGDDFSMYIMHAQNILHGTPYAETKYVYNPDTAFYGPIAYPPVFPLMITPVLAVWGINFKILKLIGLACFMIFLYLFDSRVLPKETPLGFRAAFLVTVGLYPEFFLLSNSLLTDLPFLLFCTGALIFINAVLDRAKYPRLRWWQLAVTTIFIYLTYGTRSIGLILLPLVFVFDLLKNRNLSVRAAVIVVIALCLVVLQNLLIPGTASYVDQVPKSLPALLDFSLVSLAYYILLFPSLFRFDNSSVQTAVFLIMLVIATFGVFSRCKKGISIFELFFPTYLVAIILVPSWQGLRFLVPVIPLYIFYFLSGVEKISRVIRKPAWLVQAIPLLFTAALLVYYADIYRDFLPLKTDAFSQAENRQLLEFVRSETSPEDVIAFHKPRALALFTDRKSVVVPVPDPHGDVLGRLSTLGVDVVIVRLDALEEFQPQWRQFIAEHPDKFTQVFENAAFQVYRMK